MSRASRRFDFLLMNVPGWLEPGVVIAGARCGAQGILNLEGIADHNVAARAIERICQFVPAGFGVRLDSRSALTDGLIPLLPSEIRLGVLTHADSARLRPLVDALRTGGREILIEITSGAQLNEAEGLSPDGLIAKGHEANGLVGEESTFVLLQRLLAETDLPVVAHGGVGLHSAAACYVGGAAGVVLDNQLLLTPESTLPSRARAAVEAMEGGETVCLGQELDCRFRLYKRPGMVAVEELQKLEQTWSEEGSRAAARDRWLGEVRTRINWAEQERGVWPLGQDAAHAAGLTRRFTNTAGIVQGLKKAIDEHVEAAQDLTPLKPDSPLASSHGTRYPILQGPMTRVSDTAEFANAVAENGGLPFLALAVLREARVRELLERTKTLLGDKPWGVGILGFVSAELRAEQLEVIRQVRPRFALIAGGRPDQAISLERLGIATYLHVPAPALLRMFVAEGARRFIFEGRECGGHVGPRTSFVLWEAMIDELLAGIEQGVKPDELHVVFAGGIHDARSSAMVAAMAAPLAQRGVRIGVLMGTAYLFTKEAVAGGAIVEGFQKEAIACRETVTLESGPGHATRCARTPFCDAFQDVRRGLLAENKSVQEVRDALENLNLGRLRIASKGITRARNGVPGESRYVDVDAATQHSDGMYMIGQVAGLRHEVCTMRSLHEDVSVAGSEFLAAREGPAIHLSARERPGSQPPCDAAIVGMACLFPGAEDLHAFWANIIAKADAIREVPRERFDANLYYDADRKSGDTIYSRWGGFLADVPFDPVRFGIPPKALAAIDPLQLLTLVVTDLALRDAGYDKRQFDRQRTSIVLGLSGGLGDVGIDYAVRSSLRAHVKNPPAELLARFPEWTEDSFAGILLNVAAGRVANRFDFGGVNFSVDAACGSSLAAVYSSVRELNSGSSDMVLVGGVDTVQSPFGYMCFSSSQALSPKGRCAPFDEQADGIAISEGVGILVLKRLADAERDGDRIYSVIKGVAGSSDGRGRSMTAPKPAGQVLAMRRAYEQAGFSPATVGLIEAHGTGTVAGDTAEVGSLTELFSAGGAPPRSCALGSVKSMVGHTKAAAGIAGLIKVTLSLHHRTIPPTINVQKPNPKLADPASPFYVSTEPQPWVRERGIPRRAGVSAFGFGGTNFHAAVEEYAGDFSDPLDRPGSVRWPSELFLWRGDSPNAIAGALGELVEAVATYPRRPLAELAAETCERYSGSSFGSCRLAIVASSIADLREKASRARSALAAGEKFWDDQKGIYFAPAPQEGKTAFLFPGQGSQKPGMLRDLAVQFAAFRESLELADSVLLGRYPRRFSSYIFPPPAFTPEERQEQMAAITDTVVAQPALGVVEIALCQVLGRLGIRPDMTAGHSYGEYVALSAAGVFPPETLLHLSEARGRAIKDTTGKNAGTMAAVTGDGDSVARAMSDIDGVVIANYNSPRQTVIAGSGEGVQSAITRLQAAGLTCRQIPVACAFHSPLMRAARDRFAAVLSEQTFAKPRIPVYSNTLAARFPEEPAQIAEILTRHLVSPVRFSEQIQAMYNEGARVFVEVGPKTVLTGLSREILRETDATFLHADGRDGNGLDHLLRVIAQLAVQGAGVETEALFRRRVKLGQKTMEPEPAFLVRGSGAFSKANPPRPADPLPLGETKDALPAPHPEPVLPAQPLVAPTATPPAQPLVTAAPSSVNAPLSAPPATLSTAPQSSALAASADGVMLQWQQTMAQFLRTEAAVMTAYLQGAPIETGQLAPPPVFGPTATVPAAVHPPPAPVRAVETPARPPAAAPVESHSPEPPPAAQIESKPRRDPVADLLTIVSERTGYPLEMLDLSADIEADLGIDSIKKVEILGAFRRQAVEEHQPAIQAAMDKLTAARTLRALADILASCVRETASAPAISPEPDPAPEKAPPRDVESALLNIVCERTGYPIEMLSVDAGIESDLGIDSIKRVEIIGVFRRSLPTDQQPAVQAIVDRLTSARTLGEMIDHLTEALRVASTEEEKKEEVAEAPRLRLVPVPRPREGQTPVYHPGRVVLITDDETGIASQLAETLRAGGERPLLLRHSRDAMIAADGVFSLDLTRFDAVEQLVEQVHREHGPVGGLIHVLPLRANGQTSDYDLAKWRDAVQIDAKSLFALARAVQSDLELAGEAGGALLAVITGRGGEFALRPSASVPLTHHAVADFVKTAATELTGVRCKVLDLDTSDPMPILSQKLVEELASRDALLQVGLPGDRRLTVVPEFAPLAPLGTPKADRDWVFLLTGGARGITAEIAKTIAQRYKPTLILAGRSELPPEPEPEDIARAKDPAALRTALVARLSAGPAKVKPAEVEAALLRILKDREMLQTLDELRRSGARMEYHCVDVRNEAAFRGLLDSIYAAHGRLDVVIHGAGVIEDKLIRDKTSDSFDRVVHTKADSSFVLSKNLRPEGLKCLILMSSITAAFGNRGQADYAIANGVMNGFAASLAAQWSRRVVAMNWGPWDQVGMASDEVRKQFLSRGIVPISADQGCEAVLREIEAEVNQDALVCLGSGPWCESAASVRAFHSAGSSMRSAR